MSAYQRFLPRDGTRTTAHAVAEVAEAAEAAEVKATEGVRAAEALLKFAEIRPRDRQLQQASAEVQQQQSSGIPEPQQLQQLQQAPDPSIPETRAKGAASHVQLSLQRDGAALSGVPAQWSNGVLRLGTMPPPRNYPQQAWRQLIVDAERFLDDWAAQAAALGWPAWKLFGCHKRAPWGRIQGIGLILLLRGRELAALTATEAVMRTGTGAHQTYRRKPGDPLHPADRCLVWELS
jgi:hypothetical protein